MAAIEHIHGGNMREAAEKYGIAERDVLDFSANINPLGPSELSLQTITQNLQSVRHYPDPQAVALRRKVAEWTNLPMEMIVAGNGAVELIYLLMKILHPKLALIPAPTFNEYEIAVRVHGGMVKDLPLPENKGFALDKHDVYAQWDDVDTIFICNPNNPTGCLTARQDLEEIIQKAHDAGKTVIVDEAFMDFVAERERYSVLDLVPQYDNLFVLYSLTKFFAVPGLRLGVGLGSPQVIKKINEVRDPWNVNCFAQLAGEAALTDADYIKATVEFVATEKDYLFTAVKGIAGFSPVYPSVNYILINVEGTGFTAPEICRRLGEQGIVVRDCGSYKNLRPVYIRTAVRTRPENDRLIEALRQLGRK